MNCKKNVKSRTDDEHRLFDPAVEKVVEIGLERLRPFENHPFKVKEDDSIISMVDSNLHREKILFSEKAFAYSMKNEAMKRKTGKRRKTQEGLLEALKGTKTIDLIGQETGESPRQVLRYIRLTSLIPELLDMLDEGKISFNPAVELSFLSIIEQGWVADGIEYTLSVPSVSQAKRMKALSQEKQLSPQKINEILNEIKKTDMSRVIFKNSQMYKYFPKYYSTEQMKEEIIELLEKERKRKEREKGRKKRMGREI